MECKCIGCNKAPADIEEYVIEAEAEGTTPEQYVRENEARITALTGTSLALTAISAWVLRVLPAAGRPRKV